jgi:MFS transporter, SP family, general alpha glucoside:H+ symporter
VDKSFDMGLGFLAVGILGSCLSWGLLILFGRRTIYNTGLALLAALQLLIGILDFAPNRANRPGIIWAQASILIVWNFFYNLTIGPVGFSILCETSAMHLREKTIAFATAVQAAVGIGMTVAVPYMINPDQAALGGKMGFFFGGLAALSCIWAYFRIPETVCFICIALHHLALFSLALRKDSQHQRLTERYRKIALMRSWTSCSIVVSDRGTLNTTRISKQSKWQA